MTTDRELDDEMDRLIARDEPKQWTDGTQTRKVKFVSEAAAVKQEKPQARQVRDPELIAMHEIAEVFDELPSLDAQRRVASWLSDRWARYTEPS